MSVGRRRYPLVLAVHPISRGFGWTAFEGPLTPYDWDIAFVQGLDRNSACLRAMDRILTRLEPETLVLESFGSRHSSRSARIARLCSSLIELAESRGMKVVVYSREDVQKAFASTGAQTRHEIAEAVVERVDVFGHRLPNARRAWDSEDRRMSLFSAAALALTYFNQ